MKEKALVDLHTRIEFHVPYYVTNRGLEAKAAYLENEARDFEEFIRDHRSQDPVEINVVREYQDQCSHCHNEWETDADGPVCCDKAQAEWSAEHAKAAA